MRYFYFLLIFAFFSSCSFFDKHEDSPAYIHIKKFSVQTNSTQGSNSANITEGWVYLDGNPLGVFSLPCTIPVLRNGDAEISVYAGIKDDGLSTVRAIYPFYTSYLINTTLTSGIIDTIQPVCTYFSPPICQISKEDFEDAGVKFIPDATSTVSIVKTNAAGEVFEGSYSGKMELNSSDFLAKNYYTENFVFPRNGKSAYVELDFKSNIDFIVGLEVTEPSNIVSLDNTSMKATYDDNGNLIWKKIYVNLSSLVNFHTNATGFRIYVKAVNPDGLNGLFVLIDNFKIVYAE